MTEPVASRKTRTLSPFSVLGGNGWVHAATADMNLWSHDGKLLWKKRRGFAVLALQTGIGASYRERPLTDVYQDRDAMQRWLSETLGQLAPPIKGIPAESPQLPPNSRSSSKKPSRLAKNRNSPGLDFSPQDGSAERSRTPLRSGWLDECGRIEGGAPSGSRCSHAGCHRNLAGVNIISNRHLSSCVLSASGRKMVNGEGI